MEHNIQAMVTVVAALMVERNKQAMVMVAAAVTMEHNIRAMVMVMVVVMVMEHSILEVVICVLHKEARMMWEVSREYSQL